MIADGCWVSSLSKRPTRSDVRRVGPNSAGGAMNLKLSCTDGAGHCHSHLLIEADYDSRDSLAQRVELLCTFEPAALD